MIPEHLKGKSAAKIVDEIRKRYCKNNKILIQTYGWIPDANYYRYLEG